MLPTFSSMRSSHGAPVLPRSAVISASSPIGSGEGHTFLVQGKIAASSTALQPALQRFLQLRSIAIRAYACSTDSTATGQRAGSANYFFLPLVFLGGDAVVSPAF